MQGGCHCGAIRLVAEGKPFWVGACYCADCRKTSGAPYLVFAGFNVVHVTEGTPKNYASSEEVTRSFCENCSSPIFFFYNRTPESLLIPVGIFDDPSPFKPEKHIWLEQKLPWVNIDD